MLAMPWQQSSAFAMQDKIQAAKDGMLGCNTSVKKRSQSKSAPRNTNTSLAKVSKHPAHGHPRVKLENTQDDDTSQPTRLRDISSDHSDMVIAHSERDDTHTLEHSQSPRLHKQKRVKGSSLLKPLPNALDDTDEDSLEVVKSKRTLAFTDSEDDFDELNQNVSKKLHQQTLPHLSTTHKKVKTTSKPKQPHNAHTHSDITQFHERLDTVIDSHPKAQKALAKVDKYMAKTLRPR